VIKSVYNQLKILGLIKGLRITLTAKGT
jgi:hypothetical protein